MPLSNCKRGFTGYKPFVRYFREVTLSGFPNGEIVPVKPNYQTEQRKEDEIERKNKKHKTENVIPTTVDKNPANRIKTFKPYELSIEASDIRQLVDKHLPNFEQQCCYLNFGKQQMELTEVKERLRKHKGEIHEMDYAQISDDKN